MSEIKCPECGAKKVFGEALMEAYECESQTVDRKMYFQSEECRLATTIATLTKSLEEARELLKQASEHAELADGNLSSIANKELEGQIVLGFWSVIHSARRLRIGLDAFLSAIGGGK